MNEQIRKALELARASFENFWLNGQSTQSERFEAAQAMSAIDAALSAPAAPVAQPEPSDGWASAYAALEDQRKELFERVRFLETHISGEGWVWQGDGEDHPESMVDSLPVVIRADQLRELIAAAPSPAPAPQPVSEPAFYVTVSGRLHLTDPTAVAFDLPDGRHALYTTPQPAPRAPLTDEQIYDLLPSVSIRCPMDALWFARAIERAHGIGREGGSA